MQQQPNSSVRTFSPAARVALIGSVVGAGVLIAVLAGGLGPWQDRPIGQQIEVTIDPDLPDVDVDPPPFDLPEAPEIGEPSSFGGEWVPWVLIAVGVVVLAALVIYGFQRWQGRDVVPPGPDEEPATPFQPVPSPTYETRNEAAFNTRAAAMDIIAAWQQVEEAAANVGTPRLPQHTATEFLTAVRERVAVRSDSADLLLAAYQRARFDHQALTSEQAAKAIGCAHTVVQDLRARQSPAAQPGTEQPGMVEPPPIVHTTPPQNGGWQ